MQNKSNKIIIILIAILIILTAIVIIISYNKNSVIQNPNSSEINEIIKDENIILIDVRTENEYNSGHIKNAINIPLNDIQNKIDYQKDKPLAVYCRTGKRSLEAAKTLAKMGYTKIYDLGGIENSKIELTKE